MLGAGLPLVVTVNVPAWPTVNVVLFALVIAGAWFTLMLAAAVVPVPPLVALTAPLVLFLTPPLVPVTVTWKEQLLLAAMLPPVRLMTPVAAVVVTVLPLPQALAIVPSATPRPLGRVSLTLTPVSPTVVFELVRVKVSVVVLPTRIEAAPNALAMLGGATTVRLAMAFVPVPPLAELTLPVVFVFAPAVVPVTVTGN